MHSDGSAQVAKLSHSPKFKVGGLIVLKGGHVYPFDFLCPLLLPSETSGNPFG